MNTNYTKEQVKAMLPEYLEELGINPHKIFRCICINHMDRHPSMSYDWKRNKVHCFSCGADMDIFDVYGEVNHISDRKEAFQKTFDWAKGKSCTPVVIPNDPLPLKGEMLDLTGIVKKAHEMMQYDVSAVQHFTSRGLSEEIIEEYQLGYWPYGMNNLLNNCPVLQSKSRKESLYRYVLPYPDSNGRFHYFQMEIFDRNQMDEFNGKYHKMKGVPEPVFNARYLEKDTPPVIFVVEGIYDALSIETVGGKAIALTGGTGRFLSLCKDLRPDTMFVISMDNDDAGQRYSEALRQGLEELGIPHKSCTAILGKDFNEMLQLDPVRMKKCIRNVIKWETPTRSVS
ncbi:MAG: toprim domain-containing protein [Clostridiales bacterium]|nr:toprim domain-containing protein [Clostridiales bacterium]